MYCIWKQGRIIILWYFGNQETFRGITDWFQIPHSTCHEVIGRVFSAYQDVMMSLEEFSVLYIALQECHDVFHDVIGRVFSAYKDGWFHDHFA